MTIILTQKQATQLTLAHDQWLISPLKNGTAKDTLKIIKQLGHIQIDTISVIARAHHHILWTRNRGYAPEHIDLLQTKGRHIFEYWAHAAAYLPIEAYKYCLAEMQRIKENGHDWYIKNDILMQEVQDRIKHEGPLSSIDFDTHTKHHNAGWGTSKPSKHALENLFMGGVLAITRRDSFRKVYDLAERVYAEHLHEKIPTGNKIAEYLITKCIGSLGIFSYKDVTYLRNNKNINEKVKKLIEKKVSAKLLLEITIKDTNKTYYIKTNTYEKNKQLKIQPFIRILSPFDNQVINRERLLNIFGFTYTIECYLPEHKRKYGYFALPILSHKGFIGSIDLKADRKNKIMLIKQINFNKKISKQDVTLLNKELLAFAQFNQCKLKDAVKLQRL